MKTENTNKTSRLLKLSKALTVVILMTFGLKASAQCTANFTYAVDPANNGMVSFTNTSSGSGSFHYTWYFGDGTFSYSTSPVHYYAVTGVDTIKLVISDSLALGGCSDSTMQYLSVINNTPPTCTAHFTTIDSIGNLFFYDQSYGSTTAGTLLYHWDFGNGDSSSVAGSFNYNYATSGVYYACLTVTNSAGTCTPSTYCDSVVVSSCFASFTASGDASGFGENFTSYLSGTADTYHWDFGDGNTSTVANPHHVYAAAGYYYVQLSVTSSTDPGCGYTSSSYVNVQNNCSAAFVVARDSVSLYDFTIYNYATASGIINYLWDFGDGTTSTAAYPIHTYAGAGPYYLCLSITNADSSCMATHCDSVIAGRSTTGITVTVVSPLTTGINNVSDVNTILENYPNPFSGNTTINYSISKNAAVELTVMDLLGNKVALLESSQKSAGSYATVWNADGIAPGMYLLQMKTNNRVITKKIVISK